MENTFERHEMTTKRKLLMKSVALSGNATLDDLEATTGWPRRNVQDNLKATVGDGLLERFRDDVTGQPAYKLTKQGRAWLENDKDDSCTKPQAPVGKNSASQDLGSRVAGGGMSADPLPKGKAVVAPPKPEIKPAAAGADVKAKPVVKACLTTENAQLKSDDDVWQANLNGMRVMLDERERTIATLNDLIASKDDEITELQKMMKGFGPGYSYAIMPDYPDMTIHKSLANARAEAEETVGTDGAVHVVCIVDSAEMAIKWKRAV